MAATLAGREGILRVSTEHVGRGDNERTVSGPARLVDQTKVPPEPKMFLVLREAVEVIDNWHVMGRAATGSKESIINDVFVPERRVLRPVVRRIPDRQ